MNLDKPYRAGDRLVLVPHDIAETDPVYLDHAAWQRVRVIRREKGGRAIEHAFYVVEPTDAPPEYDRATGLPVRATIEGVWIGSLYRDIPAVLDAVVAWHRTLKASHDLYAEEREAVRVAEEALRASAAAKHRQLSAANSRAAEVAFSTNPGHRASARKGHRVGLPMPAAMTGPLAAALADV